MRKFSTWRLALAVLVASSFATTLSGATRADTVFPTTGYVTWGPFETYWRDHGGLAQFGMPRTSVFPGDAQYDAQWFERALFTYHKNNPDPYKVQLNLLGSISTQGRRDEEPFRKAEPSGEGKYFSVTSHNISGKLLEYWSKTGGIPIYGYPISEAFTERSKSDGQRYTVQYFERNRLELHPELAGTAFEVQLGLLGSEMLDSNGGPAAYARLGQPRFYPASTQASATPTTGGNGSPPAPALPPAAGRVLFQADFASADLAAWRQLAPLGGADATPASWRVISGRLYQVGNAQDEGSDTSAAILTRQSDFSDFTLDTFFHPGSGEPLGAIFRYSDAGFYLLRLYPKGVGDDGPKAELYRYANGRGTQVAKSTAWPGYLLTSWQRLTISTLGSQIKVLVEGQPVLQANDATYNAGALGLYAYADGSVQFDNFRVAAAGTR
jgi:hypothetical protein